MQAGQEQGVGHACSLQAAGLMPRAVNGRCEARSLIHFTCVLVGALARQPPSSGPGAGEACHKGSARCAARQRVWQKQQPPPGAPNCKERLLPGQGGRPPGKTGRNAGAAIFNGSSRGRVRLPSTKKRRMHTYLHVRRVPRLCLHEKVACSLLAHGVWVPRDGGAVHGRFTCAAATVHMRHRSGSDDVPGVARGDVDEAQPRASTVISVSHCEILVFEAGHIARTEGEAWRD